MFDLDGNGFISKQELKDVFQGAQELSSGALVLEDGIWTKIIQEVDTNRDNLISAEEFLQSMQAVFGQHSSVL
jgi:Ca2+-binding EF-hand superfamily protein